MRSLIALAVVILLWLAGLLVFADRVIDSTPAVEPATAADAIVVLTGASDLRLKEGMRLLERRRGQRLFISGVNREVKRPELMAVTQGSKRLYECCVDLGYEAENTVGNAREIADWARGHDFYNLIVVTSDYHMPRALLELKADMPDAHFIAYPVATPELDARGWWKSPKSQRLIVVEYCKYLAILTRDAIISLSRSFGDKGGAPAAGSEDSAAASASS
ncbi:YdcF family protein [Asticcacaulis sp. EMRT-3]|uniref:YdcF family protein n=1 Tax=Asticcacaulis sp. EMRT-3 TaxID=3040349 RepID=UPI0024AF27F5|nr:YdcF family protein [Asticcacaulis sp. EMRT-3]MDI7776040.1 YdcF family protein [Asticcacaulis sp. EMRT-3]